MNASNISIGRNSLLNVDAFPSFVRRGGGEVEAWCAESPPSFVLWRFAKLYPTRLLGSSSEPSPLQRGGT